MQGHMWSVTELSHRVPHPVPTIPAGTRPQSLLVRDSGLGSCARPGRHQGISFVGLFVCFVKSGLLPLGFLGFFLKKVFFCDVYT